MAFAKWSCREFTNLVRWPNVVWQGLHLGGGGVMLLVLWLFLARSWGAERFGAFNYLFAFTAVSGIFADFGMDVLVARVVSGNRCRIPSSLFPVKLGITIFMLAGCFLAGLALGLPGLALLVMLSGVGLLSVTSFLNGFLRGIERLDIEARVGFLQKLIFVGAALLGVFRFQADILWVAYSYLLSHAVALGIIIRLASRMATGLAASETVEYRALFNEVWPLWLIALLGTLSIKMDLLFLDWLAGERSVGLYAASSRLLDGLIVMGTAYMAALFPRQVAGCRKPGYSAWLVRRSAFILLLGGGLASLAGYFFAPRLITLLYGQDFNSSIRIFQHLILILPTVYLVNLMGQDLIAFSRQGLYCALLGGGLLINTLVNLWLIPLWGAEGAVAGYWSREIFMLIILATIVFSRNRWKKTSSCTIISR